MNQDQLEKAIEPKLADRLWRLNNLYYIIDQKGKKVLFRMNEVQLEVYATMHFKNVILKSRQHGICLDPETPVLTADLRWKAIQDLIPGEKIVSVDEYGPGGKGHTRRMRLGEVEAVCEVKKQAYRITLEDGRELICTDRHPWLTMPPASGRIDWRCIAGKGKGKKKSRLKPGCYIRSVTQYWEGRDYEDGWIGGIIDGEGSFYSGKSSKQLGITQRQGDVWQRIKRYLDARDYHYREYTDDRPGHGHSDRPVQRIELCRSNELFRLFGQTRPTRFVESKWWDGKELPGKKSGVAWVKVTSIEPIGVRRLIDLQTQHGTYIANGLVSHNTTFFCILILDYILFNANKICGIIAQGLPEAREIFDNKIMYAYEHIPEYITKCPSVTPEKSNALQLKLANDSKISVATGFRSGTLHWCHVSEYGKICAKFPEKAQEIQSGTQETVHEGQIITYESTAEGPFGDFYEKCTKAEKREKSGKPIGPLDYKFFFFPWYSKGSNRTDPKFVEITEQDNEYFNRLEKTQKCTIELPQRAWYVKKKEELGALMTQEHPSNSREAFHSTVKGAFWADELQELESRIPPQITNVPHNPRTKVHTIHDPGYHWAIWFVQDPDGVYPKFINHVYFTGGGVENCCAILDSLAKTHKYRYGKHIVPLDADSNDKKVIDGKTIMTHARRNGYHFTKIKKIDNSMSLIERTRQSITDFYFDEEKCKEGLEHLFSFRRKVDKTNSSDKQIVYFQKYVHDVPSHSSTALYHFVKARAQHKFVTDGEAEMSLAEINRMNSMSRLVLRS